MSDHELYNLMTRFQLSPASLQKPCSDNLFLTLTSHIPNFEDAAPYFGLTYLEIDMLLREYSKERPRRLHMLWRWKAKNGSDATYLAIVKIFLRMNNRMLAEDVLTTLSAEQVPSIHFHLNPATVVKDDNLSEFEVKGVIS